MDYSDILGQSPTIFNNLTIETNDNYDIIDTNTLFEGQTIRIDQSPTETSWKLIPMFLDGIDGNTYVWQVGQSQNKLKTVQGMLISGNLTTEFFPVITNGIVEARKRFMDKYNEGYVPVGEELPPRLNGCKPMMGKAYCHSSNNDGIKSGEARINKFPISVMKNIDGIQAMSKLNGKNVVIRSRQNNVFPYLNHIKKELEVFMKYLPPHCELDGTLYSPNIDLKELTANIKLGNDSMIVYWISDIIDAQNMIWEERYAMIVNSYIKYLEDNNNPNTFKVLQAYTVNNYQELEEYHDKFVKECDGLAIRRYASVESDKRLAQYRPDKTNSLVVYK